MLEVVLTPFVEKSVMHVAYPTPITWAELIAGAGNDYDTGDSHYPVWIDSSTTTNKWTGNERVILGFDTSALPADCEIKSGFLRLYALEKGDTFSTPIAPNINLYGATPASEDEIVATDYANTQFVPFSDAVSFAGWPTES